MFEVTCLDVYHKIVTRLTQWDINQSLIIKDMNLDFSQNILFHFCNKNSKEALVVSPTIEETTITVKIPNSLLQEPYPIIAYMYVYSDDTSAKVLASFKIPVTQRVKPSQYQYVENINYLSVATIKKDIDDKLLELENKSNEILIKLDSQYTEYIENISKEIDEKIIEKIKENSWKIAITEIKNDGGAVQEPRPNTEYRINGIGEVKYRNSYAISIPNTELLSDSIFNFSVVLNNISRFSIPKEMVCVTKDDTLQMLSDEGKYFSYDIKEFENIKFFFYWDGHNFCYKWQSKKTANVNTSGYTLPIATNNTLGGVKIGESINISSDGIINVSAISESDIDEIFAEVLI